MGIAILQACHIFDHVLNDWNGLLRSENLFLIGLFIFYILLYLLYSISFVSRATEVSCLNLFEDISANTNPFFASNRSLPNLKYRWRRTGHTVGRT